MFSTIAILASCVVFGAACAFYVSVVGFLISSIIAIILIGYLIQGAFSLNHLWLQLGSFVVLQVGYFLGILITAANQAVGSASALSKDTESFDTEDTNISIVFMLEKILS